MFAFVRLVPTSQKNSSQLIVNGELQFTSAANSTRSCLMLHTVQLTLAAGCHTLQWSFCCVVVMGQPSQLIAQIQLIYLDPMCQSNLLQ